MVKVGDKITAEIHVDSQVGQMRQRKTGSVVYVHPKQRWLRANFNIGFDKQYQESFQIVNGQPLGAKIIHE